MDEHFHIADLIAKKVRAEITSEDENKLRSWLNEKPEHRSLFDKITNNKHLLKKLEDYQLFDRKRNWSSLEENLFGPKVIPLSSEKFVRYAASIVLPLILFSALAYYFIFSSNKDSLTKLDEFINPGTQKATLVLSEGDTLKLENTPIETVIKQGKTQIVNQNASLTYTYQDSISKPQTLTYNELITPRGGNFNLMLSDGTKVWLNAASTLKFPVAFGDSIRQVFLTGEAFFEVSHDGKPFIVNSENMDIQVLGTSFNVSDYPEEPESRATLVDGSIKLLVNNIEKMMVPNEQAIILKEGSNLEMRKVNTKLYTSWVHGKIEFNYDDLDAVMRRLARWYNFEYSFENDLARNYHFTGSIENTQSISSILEMLELTTDVTFDINDNTIIIL